MIRILTWIPPPSLCRKKIPRRSHRPCWFVMLLDVGICRWSAPGVRQILQFVFFFCWFWVGEQPWKVFIFVEPPQKWRWIGSEFFFCRFCWLILRGVSIIFDLGKISKDISSSWREMMKSSANKDGHWNWINPWLCSRKGCWTWEEL